jgi:hypothetical protein
MSTPERITLELEALPSDRSVEVRLRLVLKDLLRRQQFKCVRLSGAEPAAAAAPAAPRPRRRF